MYLELSRHYPLVKDFEVVFSPIIFDFSCFILFNLWSKILSVTYLVVLS